MSEDRKDQNTSNELSSGTTKNLREQFYDSLRDGEALEAIHQAELSNKAVTYNRANERILKITDQVDGIELNHLGQLRIERAQINIEISAAHQVAWTAFSNLGLEYVKGQSTVQDIIDVHPLHESDAAKRAGLPGTFEKPPFAWSALKWMGLIGCLILGTIGMGALVMRLSPRQLLQSPVWLSLSVGLSFILIGSATLLIQPLWRYIGTLHAGRPEESKRAMFGGVLATLVPVLLVAAVDAKAIMAINAVKSSHSAATQSFGITFLVALALSAAYVLGSAAHAFYEAFAHETTLRIGAEIDRDAREQTIDRRRLIDVDQAIEALNTVNYLEMRRKELTDEIDQIFAHYQASIDKATSGLGESPALTEDQHRLERLKKSEASFAKLKLNAYSMLPSLPIKNQPTNTESKESQS